MSVELDQLALGIKRALDNNHTLTTTLLASQLCATIQDVAFVLDEYFVGEDGVPVHAGPGQGGNWVAPEYQASFSVLEDEMGTDIGYRWPDLSLRDVAFDITNPEHREEMGITNVVAVSGE